MLAGFLIAALATASGGAGFPAVITVASQHVTVGELIDTEFVPEPLRATVAGRTVVRFGAHQVRIVTTDRELSARLRFVVPGLRDWLPVPTGSSVVLTRSDRSLSSRSSDNIQRSCMQARRRLARGDVPSSYDFVPAPCDGLAAHAWQLDRSGQVLLAARDIESGETVVGVGGGLPDVVPGKRLVISSVVGPVRVERTVTALQAARTDQSLFVRSDAGDIFATVYRGPAP